MLLQKGFPGSFLVRASFHTPGSFVLSTRCVGGCVGRCGCVCGCGVWVWYMYVHTLIYGVCTYRGLWLSCCIIKIWGNSVAETCKSVAQCVCQP